MTLEVLLDLVGQLAALGLRRLALVGGEPLTRPDLEELMRRGRERGIEGYSLVSNGSLATAARARCLREAGLRSLQISVDGVDARDHAAVRGTDALAFYRAVRAVRLFREAGVRVDVSALLNARNVERASEFLALGQALGARWLRFCSFVPAGRGADPAIAAACSPTPEQLDRFFARLRGWRAGAGKRLGLLVDHGIGPWTADGKLSCGAGRRVAYLSSDGDLYPCSGVLFPPFRVGSVLAQPLDVLLRSPAMHAARGIRRTDLAEPCGSCRSPGCRGGCRGAVYAATGDVRAAVPYCNVQRRACQPGAA
jgi:radical SAM protein with 4Fe4S-binding SPASM domain